MSLSARTKSPDDSGLKTIAPAPAGRSPSSVSSVTAAVASAKSRSRAGPASFLRPSRTSLRPNAALERYRLAQLAGDLGECGEPLLERRVGHEELAPDALHRRRDDEEGVHALDVAQIALRDAEHVARDLLQRAHQMLWRARDQRRAAVGRELPVPRDREDQDLAEEVGHDGDHQDDQPHRYGVVVPVTAAAEHPRIEAEPREQARDHGEEARDGHDQHVAVRDVRELVSDDSLDLLRLETLPQ